MNWIINFAMSMVLGVILSSSMVSSMYSSGLFDFYDYGYGYDPTMFLNGLWPSIMAIYIPLIIWSLINLIPSLAILVRRLHDTGKRWYWLFLFIIPIAGFIIWIIFMVSESKLPHENELGNLRQV